MTNEPLNQPGDSAAESTADLTALENSLGALTIGPDAEPSLWKTALERVAPADKTATQRFWSRRLPTSWSIAASILLVVGTLLLLAAVGGRPVNLSSSELKSSTARYFDRADGAAGVLDAKKADMPLGVIEQSAGAPGVFQPRADDMIHAFFLPGMRSKQEQAELSRSSRAEVQGSPVSSTLGTADRYVIRKATLDLSTNDVRATFSKSAFVINEALGEYIETSSLTGEGQGAQGSITLRVAASRLSEVLKELRPLGTVVAENSTGQDVTESVVDLEARIRNEERIERELLALIDKRPDAPLKDVLEIRAQLSSVRAQIEGMMGQRQRIGRLVSLATVLVTIRAKDAPVVVEKERGIGDYFVASVESSWNSALRTLADTAAGLIRVFVGGIFWWALVGGVAVLIWRAANRAAAKRAAEPAPTA